MATNVMNEAWQKAQGVMDKALDQIVTNNGPSERELVNRYRLLHRGNALAMAQFVAKNAPPGSNPLTEMRRYEAKMEGLMDKYGLSKQDARTRRALAR